MSDETKVYTRVTSYDVSVWPDDIECIDSGVWKLTVQYRGDDRWSVNQCSVCLSKSGEWDWEMHPSERTDQWLTEHRFGLQVALLLAAKHAPDVFINGLSAVEVLARHRARLAGKQ